MHLCGDQNSSRLSSAQTRTRSLGTQEKVYPKCAANPTILEETFWRRFGDNKNDNNNQNDAVSATEATSNEAVETKS